MKEYFYNDFNLEAELAERGVKKTGVIHFARRPNGTWIDLPVMFANGVEDGPVLLMDACHHGDEHEGTEGIIGLFHSLDVSLLRGSVVCVPVLNVEAFSELRRYGTQDLVPLDMNRVYPGQEDGTLTKVLAKYYFDEFVKKSTALITIHGGGNYLYLEPICDYMSLGDETSRISREMAEVFGLEKLWLNDVCIPHNGILDENCAEYKIPVILPEIGGQVTRLELREQNVARVKDGIRNVMRYFKMLDEEVITYDDLLHVRVEFLYTKHGGIHKPLKKGGEKVKKGEVLAIITDLFGNEVDRTIAPYDCVIVGYWAYSVAMPSGWSYVIGEVMDV